MVLDQIIRYYLRLSNNFLFIRLLVFLLIFLLVFIFIKKISIFRENKRISIIISLVISLMAIFYMKEEMLKRYILITNNLLGLYFLFGLPFIILLFIAHKSGMTGAGRKIIWVFFGIALGIVWLNNYSNDYGVENNIFLVFAIIIILAILADKQINSIFRRRKRKL